MAKRLVLLDREDVAHLGGAIGLSGGSVLPAPITRWGNGEWDARAFSGDRLAIVGEGLVGSDRKDVTGEIEFIRAALAEYQGDDEIDDTISAIIDF